MANSRGNLSENLPGIDIIKNNSGGVTGYKFRCCVGREKVIDENGKEHVKQIWRALYVSKDDARIVDKRIDNTIKKLAAYRTEWAEQQKKEYEISKTERLQKATRKKKVNTDTITFREFVNDHWLKDSIIGNADHKPSTVNYYQFMAKDLVDYFGDTKLIDIETEDVVKYVNYLRTVKSRNGKTISPTTQKRHYQTLQTIFKYAMRVKYIKEDPLSTLSAQEKPKDDPDKRVDFLDETEAPRFIKCLEEEPIFWKAMVNVLITCGLRRGECLGLQWRDINPDKLTITVSRSVTINKYSEEKINVGPTKTGKTRIVPVSTRVYNLLLNLKTDQEEKLKQTIPEDGFIFSRTEDPYKPIYPTEPTRFMRKFVKRHNLPDVSPHDLRHTAATLAIIGGADEEKVQDLLGHADRQTTERFYIGVSEELKRRKEESQRQTLNSIESILNNE